MIPMIRMLGFLLIILTVVYIVVSIWSRNVRRKKLEDRWDSKDVLTSDRDAFIQRGLEQYDKSFRRKLILLVTDGEPADIDERDPQHLRHGALEGLAEQRMVVNDNDAAACHTGVGLPAQHLRCTRTP